MMKKKMLLIGCAAAIAVVAGGTLLWMNWKPDAEYRFRVRFHSTRERSSTLQLIDGYAFSVCSRNLKMTMNLKDVIISPGAFSQANDLSEYRGVNRLGIQRENDGYWFFDGRRLDMRWRSQDDDQ